MASELSMNGRKKIETLQQDFNEKFEYLNLTFFDNLFFYSMLFFLFV